MRQTEGERVFVGRGGEFVPHRFAGEIIRGGSQRAIRAAAKRGIRIAEFGVRIGNVIRGFKRRSAGVYVDVFPVTNAVVRAERGFDGKNARGTEVRPSE